MNLSDYIKANGIEKCAALFGANPWTVKSWRNGERFPRPAMANRIVQVTGGEVSLAGIYAARNKAA